MLNVKTVTEKLKNSGYKTMYANDTNVLCVTLLDSVELFTLRNRTFKDSNGKTVATSIASLIKHLDSRKLGLL